MNEPLIHPLPHRSTARLATAAICIALLAVALSGMMLWRTETPVKVTKTSQADSAMSRIKGDNVLKVGYGVWPPFSILDEAETDSNKKLKGFSIDLVNEIAARCTPPLRVEWHRFNWDTMRADLSTRRFDFVCETVFQTVPRAADFGLSEPYAAFGLAAAVVRKDETRFVKFEDLNREDITISLAEGWTTSEFARAHLSKPKFLSVTVREDTATQMSSVIAGRADVALNDVPSVINFVRAHEGEVKALWVESPPTMVIGGFVTRPEDRDLLEFLNACIRILRADGTLQRLDAKWKTTGYFYAPQLSPGSGLRSPP